jgi:hypothetical protein
VSRRARRDGVAGWGLAMLAMTRSRPPQRRQVSISMANTRLRRCAQVRARCRSVSVADASPRSLAAVALVFGNDPGPIAARRREHAVISRLCQVPDYAHMAARWMRESIVVKGLRR